MPIPFNCPHCGKATTVADEYAGQKGPCAACGQMITIPMAGAPSKSSGSGSSGAIIAVVVGVIGVGLLMVIGILVALLLPAVQAARFAARRAQSQNNMKQIALALHNYHDTFQTLPPAYIANEDGSLRTSWRTMILPFLEQQPLHDSYDFGRNWDDPINLGVRQSVVPTYLSPNAGASVTPQETHYLLLTGKGTAFDGDKATKFREMLDGLSNIVLAVEVTGTGIEWSQPKDLPLDQLPALIESGAIGTNGTVNIMMADGSVQSMATNVAASQLPAMARIADRQ